MRYENPLFLKVFIYTFKEKASLDKTLSANRRSFGAPPDPTQDKNAGLATTGSPEGKKGATTSVISLSPDAPIYSSKRAPALLICALTSHVSL